MASLVSYALCSVADVKESLGITDTSKDNLIIRKINATTDMIERYAGRRFKSTSYTEYYDVDGGQTINLNNYPVTTLTSVSYRASIENIDTWEVVDSQLYFCDENAGIVEFLFDVNRSWEKYKIVYTAGYATIPNDLAEACATVAAYMASQNPATIDSKSVQEGQRKQEFFDTSQSNSGIFTRLGVADVIDSYSTPIISGRP